MRRSTQLCWTTLALVTALGGGAAAQTGQRSALEVVVTDPHGAVVPAARITLSGPRLLGGTLVVQANADGRFVFDGLLPGSYDVTAAAKGFQKAERSKIELPVETTYVVPLSLVIEGVSEHVDVRAAPALIDVRTAATPTVFDEPLLHDLPVQHTLQSILALAPGVVTSGPVNGYVGEVAFGGTQGSNGLTVDGVNLTESSEGAQWGTVHYNWLEGAQVIALGAPAEYGAFTGAIMNGVLRSGSNNVRGMGEWLTVRPGWTANNLGDLPAGASKPISPETILSWWDVNGQVGLPIVRDRLWAFGGISGVHHEYRPSGYDGPGTNHDHTSLAILKLDAAPSRDVRLQGFVTRNASDGSTTLPSNPTPASTPIEFVHTYAWNARATWILSPTTVLDVRASGNSGTDDIEPQAPATLEGPSPQTELTTGVACCNSFWRFEGRSSVLAGVTLDHHKDGWVGTHDFKAGLEWQRSPFDEQDGVPTNQVLTTQNGEVVQIEQWAGDHRHLTATHDALYFEDRWRLSDRVTLEPGLRLEVNLGSVPGVDGDYVTGPLAPRMGVVWDVNGTHSTVIRAHYGRYHDPLYGLVYAYTQPHSASPHIFYQVVDGTPVESFRYIEELDLPSPTRLKQSHVDQFVAGLERSLDANTTVQVQYIGRHFGNFIGWIDRRLGDWTPVEVQDPGPDGLFGTPDDRGAVTVYQNYAHSLSEQALDLGNPDGAYRWYNGLQFITTRRFARNWQYQVSYSWSRSEGTIGNEYRTNATNNSTTFTGYGANANKNFAPPTPPTFDYSEFKAIGSYRAPWLGGFTSAAVFHWRSGTRWTRVVRTGPPLFLQFQAEPIRGLTTPSVGALDLRFEKTFHATHQMTLGLYADIFNATNVGRATTYNALSGPHFGEPFNWTDPRTGRIGLRCSF